MPRYLLSVFTPENPGEFGPYSSEEEMRRAFADTGRFNDGLEAGGHLVFAGGLMPPQEATTVDGRGDEPEIGDGPYLTGPRHLGGFWVVDAADLDEAKSLAAQGSKACRGVVEVRPFHSME